MFKKENSDRVLVTNLIFTQFMLSRLSAVKMWEVMVRMKSS